MNVRTLAFVTVWAFAASTAFAQDSTPAASETPAPAAAAAPAATPAVFDAGTFKIGIDDVLDIQVWKNADLSRTVPVRPDGFISLPLVNDIKAAGLTPTEL